MVWYPAADVRRYRLDGGSMVGGAPRIVLHTTETQGVPRYGDPAGSNSAPHFTVGTDGAVFQHQPINRASRSLRNTKGGVETNRQGLYCVQIEIVGYARDGSNLPGPQLAALRALVAWIIDETGIDPVWRDIDRGSHCYGVNSPCRMGLRQWVTFEGVCGHQEVAENDHWDPGDFDIGVIFTEEEQVMRRGDRGNAVRKLQLALKAWNPDALPIAGPDGDYGPETEEWVRRYQQAAELQETGVADGVTVAFLLEYLADAAQVINNSAIGAHNHPEYAAAGHIHEITGTAAPTA